jgi:hypothetical protein
METVKEIADARAIADEVFRKLQSSMQYPEFGTDEITVVKVAAIMHKSPNWVKNGIEQGWLPIGIRTKTGKKNRSFYISPKWLWEVTGYVWKGDNS